MLKTVLLKAFNVIPTSLIRGGNNSSASRDKLKLEEKLFQLPLVSPLRSRPSSPSFPSHNHGKGELNIPESITSPGGGGRNHLFHSTHLHQFNTQQNGSDKPGLFRRNSDSNFFSNSINSSDSTGAGAGGGGGGGIRRGSYIPSLGNARWEVKGGIMGERKSSGLGMDQGGSSIGIGSGNNQGI